MSDLISREPVIEWLKTAGHFLKVWHGRKNNDALKVIGYIINHIEKEPAADAVEVVHAKWKLNDDGSGTCDCGVSYGKKSISNRFRQRGHWCNARCGKLGG